MKERFKDRVVIITGASSGIGEALAKLFALEGARVVLTARTEEKLKKVTEEIVKNGGKAIHVRGDVGVREDVKNVFKRAIDEFSRVDILVNNAGVGLYSEVEKIDDESLLRIFRTNLFGALYCIQEAIPVMKKQGRGHIVNISSVAGRRAMPGVAGYSMTKFALHALSESLRVELRPYNIHVTVITPGLIRTDFPDHAMRAEGTPPAFSKEIRWTTPERCAKIILNAIHRKKREKVITAGGKLLVFMNKFFPSFTDFIVEKIAPLLRGV